MGPLTRVPKYGLTCPPLVQEPFPTIGNITFNPGQPAKQETSERDFFFFLFSNMGPLTRAHKYGLTCPPLVQEPFPASGNKTPLICNCKQTRLPPATGKFRTPYCFKNWAVWVGLIVTH